MKTRTDGKNAVWGRKLSEEGKQPKWLFGWCEPGRDYGFPRTSGRPQRLRYRRSTQRFTSDEGAEQYLWLKQREVDRAFQKANQRLLAQE